MKLPMAGLTLAFGASLYLGVSLYGTHQQMMGILQSQIAVRDSTIKALQHSTKRVDSIYIRDTVRLTKWQTKYVTSRDTLLQHLTDTLRIKEYVHVADSTIQACSRVVLTCQQRVSQRDSIISLQQLQLKALGRKDRVFGLLPAPSRTLTFAAGLLGGYLLAK